MKYLKVGFILVLLFLFASCSSTETFPISLSEEQIQHFVHDKHITPISIKNSKRLTLILYEDKLKIGYYVVSIHLGKVQIYSHKYIDKQSVGENVTIETGGMVIGKKEGYTYIFVVINEPKLIQTADKIVFNFQKDSMSEPINSRKAVIALKEYDPDKENLLYSFQFYDKENRILFRREIIYE